MGIKGALDGARVILIGVSMCHQFMGVCTYVYRRKPPQTLDYTVDCLKNKAV